MIGKIINKLTGLAAGIFLCLLPFAVSVECRAAIGDNRWYFSHFTSSYSGLSFNNVTAVSQDSNGFIWISTEDGLNRFDGTSFERYYKEQLGVNTDFITSLCPDSEGNMWIGTDDGVTFYSHKDDCFFPVDKVSDKGTKISGKVTQISIDRDGTVWMSVNGLGLFSYYPETGELRNWFTENGHTVLPANIRSFYIDGNGEFWLALYFLDLWHSDASLESIEPARLEGWKSNDDIMAIVRNPSDNSVYLAAWQNGLCAADLRKGTFRTVIENRIGFRPTDLAIDRDKGIWLSTTGGLFRYDSVSGAVERFGSSPEDKFSLADENATAVFVDRSNGLWVGTLSSGLNYSAAFQRNFDKYYLADNETLKGCYVMDMSDDTKGVSGWPARRKDFCTLTPRPDLSIATVPPPFRNQSSRSAAMTTESGSAPGLEYSSWSHGPAGSPPTPVALGITGRGIIRYTSCSRLPPMRYLSGPPSECLNMIPSPTPSRPWMASKGFMSPE